MCVVYTCPHTYVCILCIPIIIMCVFCTCIPKCVCCAHISPYKQICTYILKAVCTVYYTWGRTRAVLKNTLTSPYISRYEEVSKPFSCSFQSDSSEEEDSQDEEWKGCCDVHGLRSGEEGERSGRHPPTMCPYCDCKDTERNYLHEKYTFDGISIKGLSE